MARKQCPIPKFLLHRPSVDRPYYYEKPKSKTAPNLLEAPTEGKKADDRRRSEPNFNPKLSRSTESLITAVEERSRSQSVSQLKRRKNSMSADVLIASLGFRFGLNEPQKRALAVTWARIETDQRENAMSFMEKLFANLCKKDPGASSVFVRNYFVQTIKPVFQNSVIANVKTQRDHLFYCKWFVAFLIESLDKEAKPVIKQLQEIGRKHAKLDNLGLRAHSWEQFGCVFANKIATNETVRHYPEAMKAWNLLIGYIVDELKNAYEKEVKIQKKVALSYDSC